MREGRPPRRMYNFYEKTGFRSYGVWATPVSAEYANGEICGLNVLKTKAGKVIAFLWDHEISSTSEKIAKDMGLDFSHNTLLPFEDAASGMRLAKKGKLLNIEMGHWPSIGYLHKDHEEQVVRFLHHVDVHDRTFEKGEEPVEPALVVEYEE